MGGYASVIGSSSPRYWSVRTPESGTKNVDPPPPGPTSSRRSGSVSNWTKISSADISVSESVT